MKPMFSRALGALLGLLFLATAAFGQFTEQRVWIGTTGGSGNAQTATLANAGSSSIPLGVPIRGLAGFTNTGAATLTINSGTPTAIYKPSSSGATALTGGEIIAGQLFEVVYDGTRFQLTANNAQAAAIRTSPQGYLTPCQVSSGSPVSGCSVGQLLPTGDVSAATVLYYEPAFGNQIPIYNGSNMIMTSFGELTLTIPSSRLANTIYDVCVFSNSGTVTAVFGPAWTTSTAGSGARGTGAGTAEIAQVQGLWTNAVQISAVNGASTYTIPANQCTYVATVLIGGSNGQVNFTSTWGQSRVWSAWNAYNQQDITLAVGDPTASWAYGVNTIRASNGNSANKASVVVGLPSNITADFRQSVEPNSASTTRIGIGIGVNSTTAYSGFASTNVFIQQGSASVVAPTSATALYRARQPIGLYNYQTLENSTTGTAANFDGGSARDMQMAVSFRG